MPRAEIATQNVKGAPAGRAGSILASSEASPAASSPNSNSISGISENYKIQISMSPKMKDVLFEMVEKTDAGSAAKLTRDALKMYNLIVQKVIDQECEMIFRSKDGSKETQVLIASI